MCALAQAAREKHQLDLIMRLQHRKADADIQVESVESQSSLIRTGHVGNHWRHLARSLTDGCGILEGLQCRLERVNKNTNFLSRQRKQLRLNLATDDIKAYRRRLKSHRDAMQLSLSAIIV